MRLRSFTKLMRAVKHLPKSMYEPIGKAPLVLEGTAVL